MAGFEFVYAIEGFEIVGSKPYSLLFRLGAQKRSNGYIVCAFELSITSKRVEANQ